MNESIAKEIGDLAEHHREILERKFPNYDHSIKAYNLWIFVRTKHRGTTVLEAAFLSGYISIRTFFVGHNIVLDYADPKFTDDTLIDMLEELG